MKKKIKGQYGYLTYQRRVELIKTLLLFAIALSVFIIGYINTGKKENLFTVISILGMLPACRNAVTCFMFYRYHGGKSNEMERIQEHAGDAGIFFDSVITTTSKSYPVYAFTCVKGNIIGYSNISAADGKIVEKHLKDFSRKNGIKNVTVTIILDLQQFLNRLDELQRLQGTETETNKVSVDEQALTLIGQLSL